MNKPFSFALLPVLALTCRMAFCGPSSSEQALERQKAVLAKLPEWRRKTLGWTARPWKADDKPFLITEAALASLSKQNQLAQRFDEFEREAVAKPDDALKQFRWASAAWLLKHRYKTYNESAGSLYRPYRALWSAPFPDAPAYARLLFLIEAFRDEGITDALVWPGERVLQQRPQSPVIKYYFARVLSRLSSLASAERAVKIFTELRQAQPDDVRYTLGIADTYYNRWSDNKRRADLGDKAVAAWQEVLGSPILVRKLSTEQKKFITDTIAYIRKQQKLWAR